MVKPYALITGGSSGIGLSFVKQLAVKGYHILIVSNQEAKLAQLEVDISHEFNVECHAFYCDLSLENAAQEVYEFVIQQKIEIEVLINNAGILISKEFIDVEIERVKTLLNLHIRTSTLLCHYFSKEMARKKKGYILNISSTSAYMPYPLISLYGPSKTYIRNFTRALRNELYDKKIHVSYIMPGAVDTSLYNISTSKIKLAKFFGIMHNPEFIAKRGLRILFNNRRSSIPGFMNKLTLLFLKFVPDFVIRMIMRIQKRKTIN